MLPPQDLILGFICFRCFIEIITVHVACGVWLKCRPTKEEDIHLRWVHVRGQLVHPKFSVLVNIESVLHCHLNPIFSLFYACLRPSLVAQTVKSLPAMQETLVWSLNREDPLEKGMLTHFSILAWEIYGQRSLAGHSPQGRKESNKNERLTLSLHFHPCFSYPKIHKGSPIALGEFFIFSYLCISSH